MLDKHKVAVITGASQGIGAFVTGEILHVDGGAHAGR
jgi:NAD(P)-dependent dehydrogenase (short-subunit alcohol dehydrogenase family)